MQEDITWFIDHNLIDNIEKLDCLFVFRDIGGQPRFRSMWERYCRGVNAIVYMVDAADLDKMEGNQNNWSINAQRISLCDSFNSWGITKDW